jgi:hypothetical protein
MLEGLTIVGFALAVLLLRPLWQSMRILEQQKRPRGDQGQRLLKMMAPCPGRGLSLRGRDLRGEDLAGAFLADTDLSDTDLRGVDLRGANLGGARLVGATYDARTQWPEGFDPRKHGAVREE